MRIFCNFIKPNVVSIGSVCAKPCHADCKDTDFWFRMRHEFSVEVFCENNDGVKPVAVLSGMRVNVASVQDRTECITAGFEGAVKAACSGFKVDSLAVINDVAIVGDAPLDALSLMMKKVFCIACQCMTYGFGEECCSPAIYFDFRGIADKELIVSLLSKYLDGDVRSEWVDSDCLFIHKIPWHPNPEARWEG